MNGTRQQSIKGHLEIRSRVMDAIRRFFTQDGFLEVETPIRIPAPAPEPHINAIPAGDRYLQTSPELYMKRLLAAGYSRLYQICKCFRADERGHRHLPEFTMLEYYAAGWDYTDLMRQCESLIRFLCRQISGTDALIYQDRRIVLDTPWPKITVSDAFARYAKTDVKSAIEDDSYDEIMAFVIEPNLPGDRPVFLYDYPAEKGALSRPKADNPAVAERFELYIAGIELCNGFSELKDPAEQRRRFTDELTIRKKTGKPVYPLPEPFLSAVSYMPEAAGNAIGIDRLVMLLADSPCIEDVVAFVPEEG